MRNWKGILNTILILMVLISGCGTMGGPLNPTEPLIFGNASHDIRTYEIIYKITGNFEQCGIVYRNEKIESVSGIKAVPGWTHTINITFDFTKEPYKSMSLFLLAQEQGPGGNNKNITTEIWVNGQLRFTNTDYGDDVVVISSGPLSRFQNYKE